MIHETILRLEAVTLKAGSEYEYGLADVSLSVGPGERLLIRLEPGMPSWPLGDVIQGLVEPDEGRVFFEGKTWRQRTPDDAAAARARIGRVYEQSLWISNLDVDENLRLAPRHHTHRPDKEIEAEAVRWARALGLEDLPRMRPARARSRDLRVAEWVRALIGARSLLLLERPLRGAYPERAGLLAAAAREQGAAIIWLQEPGDPDIVKAFEPTRTYEVRSETLVAG